MNETTLAPMTREEAFAKGLGSGDVSAIMGTNPYRSRLEVYFTKIGKEPKRPKNEAQQWAERLSPVIRQGFEDGTGLTTYEEDIFWRHREMPYLIGTHRYLVEEGEQTGILDVRCTNAFNWKAWEKEVPAHIYTQIQFNLFIFDYQFAYVACLIGGNSLKIHRVERNDVYIPLIVEECKKFWEEHVEKQIVPPLDGSNASEEYLKELYPAEEVIEDEDKKVEIALPHHTWEWAEQYERLKAEIKELENEKKRIQNQFKHALGLNQRGYVGLAKVKWTIETRRKANLDILLAKYPDVYAEVVEETTSRRFDLRIKS